MVQNLWRDEQGAVGSAELLLIMTIMVIGVVVGMKSFRDAAVTEFADLAQALANLDQSYSYGALTVVIGDTTVTTAPAFFADEADFCDSASDTDTSMAGSKCIDVGVPAVTESGGP
jgi:Flp pilus assembly pilin Flp